MENQKDRFNKLSDLLSNSPREATGYMLHLQDTLIDISTFLIRFASWIGIDATRWPKAIMSKQVHSCEVYHSSRNVLDRILYMNDIASFSMSIILLRQAIELRTLELLGIKMVQDSEGNPVKITANRLFPLLQDRKNVKLPINAAIIDKIYTWTNQYVHLGQFDFCWKIDFAHHLLGDFFSNICNPLMKRSYYDNLEYKIKNIINGEHTIQKTSLLLVEVVDDDRFDELISNDTNQ